MMFLDLKFLNGRVLRIQLFNNSSVKNWFEFFKFQSGTTGFYTIAKSKRKTHHREIHDQWNIILTTLEELSELGFILPFGIEKKWDFDQHTLNKLHRFFTHNAIWYRDFPEEPNPFDRLFKVPSKLADDNWLPFFDRINKAVHVLEKASHLNQNSRFIEANYPIDEVVLEFSDKSTWMHFTNEEILHNYTYFDYCHYSNLVCLGRTILGKCLLQSFYDDDDPRDKDCTGRTCSNGTLILDRDDNKRLVYHSKEFSNWLKFYQLDLKKIPLEFPIGRALNFTQEFDFSTTENISFYFVDT